MNLPEVRESLRAIQRAATAIAEEADRALSALENTDPANPSRWLCYPVHIETKGINSPFGVESAKFTHEGIDFYAPLGTPVLASADGVVSRTYEGRFYGKCVVITHPHGGKTYTTYSAHLDRWSVAAGQRVRQGETIGASGNTGNSTGPHFHMTLVEVGNPKRLRGISLVGCIDPMPLIMNPP